MPDFTIKPLSPATWDDFAALVERHNGVWGGCWCLEFHAEGAERNNERRHKKQCRVNEGRAHAALVYAGDQCIGWCQFGSPDELPRIKHQRAYRAGLEHAPDWRITCLFVDQAWRGQGVSAAAIEGALNEIARLGGGMVESYPEDLAARTVSSSFHYNGSLSTFEAQGFTRQRQLGKHHWVLVRQVPPAKPD